ncbi:RICIN domain-containing protein [Streptomyces sp. NPDC088725]|uniref:RICIN domain-containing protein n=1 Tax=Streptomyces sp. NPDC088725 TaxID=3365873 RepID=UPI003823C459
MPSPTPTTSASPTKPPSRPGKEAGAPPKPTTKAPSPEPSGRNIRSFDSGLCLSAGSGAEGQRLVVDRCSSSSASQSWAAYGDGTLRAMGKCVTAEGSDRDGAAVRLSSCDGRSGQQFSVNGSFRLANADKCVQAWDESETPGSQLEVDRCNGRDSQKWQFADVRH